MTAEQVETNVRHEGCPHAVEAGQTVAYHHVNFHRSRVGNEQQRR